MLDLDVYYEADSIRFDRRVLNVVTREVFRETFAQCLSIGFEADGKPIGGVIFDGKVPHIAVLPQWRGRWGTLLRPMLAWLFAIKDDFRIHVEYRNAPLRRFVAHCGWPVVDADLHGTFHRVTPDGARGAARLGNK
ncbi:MAG TPA: GNAT family N-acetyltransferase [Burkholderiaceae bacterium]